MDKLTIVDYSRFKKFATILYNRILSELDETSLDSCVFSNIGDITSGSTHIMKFFQEINAIDDSKFVDYHKLRTIKNKKNLLLLDDFVGSGNTFVRWHNQNSVNISGYSKVMYCVLTAFERGIEKIQNVSKLRTIFGYQFESTAMITNRSDISPNDKQRISQLINKYKANVPKGYQWGYDECQLLISFENNMPNNSIGILWSDFNWIPLVKRK